MSEMLSLQKSGIGPREYDGTIIRLRCALQDIGKSDLTDREQRIYENLLLGVSSLYDTKDYDGLLGEDQLKILWAVEEAVRNSGHKVDCGESKRRAADHMFDDIAMRFVFHPENATQVVTRANQIKSRYINVVQSLALYHDLEGIRKVARKARMEMVEVLSVYDWHLPTSSNVVQIA